MAGVQLILPRYRAAPGQAYCATSGSVDGSGRMSRGLFVPGFHQLRGRCYVMPMSADSVDAHASYVDWAGYHPKPGASKQRDTSGEGRHGGLPERGPSRSARQAGLTSNWAYTRSGRLEVMKSTPVPITRSISPGSSTVQAPTLKLNTWAAHTSQEVQMW